MVVAGEVPVAPPSNGVACLAKRAWPSIFDVNAARALLPNKQRYP